MNCHTLLVAALTSSILLPTGAEAKTLATDSTPSEDVVESGLEPQGSTSPEEALPTDRVPSCDEETGEWPWYLSDLLIPGLPIHLFFMPSRADSAPPGESELWWGYFGMKTVGYLAFYVSVPFVIRGLGGGGPDASLGFGLLFSAMAVIVTSNFIFVPLIEHAQQERCDAQKLAGLPCASRRVARSSGFTLSPLVLPDPDGSTFYGLTGGLQF